MFFFFLLAIMIESIVSYEVIKQEDTQYCGSVYTWKNIEGGAVICGQCKRQTTDQAYFISASAQSTGLIYETNANNLTQPFSYITVDILYFQIGGTKISISLNSSPTQVITSPNQSFYEEGDPFICPESANNLYFLRASIQINLSSLPANNLISFKVLKEKTSQILRVYKIRISTNCRKNCLTCLDSKRCDVCIDGFLKRKMVSGEIVCEQFQDCTIQNCLSCHKGNTIEICNSCYAGFQFDAAKINCIPNTGAACPAGYYRSTKNNCAQYASSGYYIDQRYQIFQSFIQAKFDPSIYKCPTENFITIYDYENNSVIRCGCNVINCNSCSLRYACKGCRDGYTIHVTQQICISKCATKQYYETNSPSIGCTSCPDANCNLCTYSFNGCDNCPSGYYFDSIPYSCQPCPDSNCLQCTTKTNCTQCKSTYAYNSTDLRCNKVCLSNQYYDHTNNTCITCPDSHCLSCVDSTSCSNCINGYSYSSTDQRCNKICQTNEYYDFSSDSCVVCPDTNCLSCSSSTVCTNCSSGYSYSSTDQRCDKICQSNEYYDQANNNCITCPDTNCHSCSSSTVCKNCSTGYSYNPIDQRCDKTCQSNEYYDQTNNNCITCPDANCLSCRSSTFCTNCSSGFSYNSTDQRCNKTCQSNEFYDQANNDCITCPDTNCLSCNSSTVCTNCSTGYSYNSIDQRCNKTCQSNQYYDQTNNDCITCPDTNCLSCSNSSNCTNCSSGYSYSQTDQRCNKTCQSNQYYDQTNNDCITCPDTNCLSCSNSSNCTNCISGYSYSQTDQRCIQDCKSNEFLNSATDTCIQCSQSCSTCNQVECTKCQDLNQFVDITNKQNCISCQIQNCHICQSGYADRCQSCQPGYSLNQQNSSCTQSSCDVKNCDECVLNSEQECKQCSIDYQLTSAKTCASQQLPNAIPTSFEIKSQDVNDEGYSITVEFSKETNIIGVNKENLINLEITDTTQFEYNVEQLTSKEIQIEVKSNSSIKYQTITITIIDETFVKNNYIEDTSIQEELKPYVIISPSEREAGKQVAYVSKSVSTVVVTTMLPIVIISNFYVLVNTIDITGFLYYMLFINIRQPDNVVQFYSIFKDFQFPFIPNFFDKKVDPNYIQKSPPKFMQKDTDRYFIKNTGQTMTIWGGIISLYIFIKVLSKVKINKLQDYLAKSIENTWEYNSFFDLLWNTYIYPLVGALLQMYTYDFNDPTFWLNYTLHSIFLVISLTAPFGIFYLLYKQKDIKNNLVFQKKYATLVGGIRLYSSQPQQEQREDNQNEIESIKSIQRTTLNTENRQLKSSQLQIISTNNNTPNKEPITIENSEQKIIRRNNLVSFSSSIIIPIKLTIAMRLSKYQNAILYFRKLLFGIIIVCANEYVYFQLASISIMNLSVLIFTIKVKPLQSNYENIKNAAGEIVLILIMISAFFLVEDDQDADEQSRQNIGWVIVGLSSFIFAWHTIQILIETLKSLAHMIKHLLSYLTKRSSKVQPAQINLTTQNQDAGSLNKLVKSDKEEVIDETIIKNLEQKAQSNADCETNGFYSTILAQNVMSSQQQPNLTRRRESTFSTLRQQQSTNENYTPQSLKNIRQFKNPFQKRSRKSMFQSNFTSQTLILQQENQSVREYIKEEDKLEQNAS